MNFVRLYTRVLELLGPEARLGWTLAVANLALAAAQFAEPVLFGRIIDALAGAQTRGRRRPGPTSRRCSRAWVGVRAVHHRLRRAGRAARRPAGAPPPPRGADRLFRARPAAAAQLPRRHPFRPAAEGDAHRHRLAVVAVARLLPRAFRGLRVAARAAAAVAVPELAAGAAADRPVRRVRRPDRAGHPQDRELQSDGRAPLLDLAERASDALGNVALVQSFARIEAEVGGCATSSTSCSARRCRCCPGGRCARC